MRTGVFALLIIVYCRVGSSQIVLSEIMFNPAGNERYDEFIELYNLSDDESVDLAGWLVSDSSKFNLILPYEETALLPPHHYAVILVPNYFEKSRIYDAEIPDEALLLTIGNAQFGAYGLKNSAGERVSLHRPDSTLVAAWKYSPDNKDGFSEEKIDLSLGDDAANWSNSQKPGGTPGYKNSVAPSAFDLALGSFTLSPKNPGDKDSLAIRLGVRNVGKEVMSYVDAALLEQTDDGENILQSRRIETTLFPGDSIDVHFTLPPFAFGEHILTARIGHEKDENIANNVMDIEFKVVAAYSPGSVVINEIMYDTDEKADEWLELFNATTDGILLQDWRIADKRKTTVICDSTRFLAPGDYCVLANRPVPGPDSTRQIIISLPELNNSGDELVLLDAAGTVIDSVAYTRAFGGERNVSLERIRYEEPSTAENWGSCRDSLGSTPGRSNSISPRSRDAAIDGAFIDVTPQHPLAWEPVTIGVRVVNSGRQEANDISIHFSYAGLGDSSFSDIGRQKIARLEVNDAVVVSTSWHDAPAGAYRLLAELSMPGDMQRDNNSALDTVLVSGRENFLVINEIMYSPAEGMGEWLELLNRSSNSVQIFGWSMGKTDSLSLTFCSEPRLVPAGEFIVLARDSSVLDISNAAVFVLKKMPALKNDGDVIRILDGNGRVVDQVDYSATWGGARGRSLERINPQVDSNEASNWSTCVKAKGHTCGANNSVFIERLPEAVSLDALPNPFSPDGDGVDDFVAISYTVPATTASVNMKIYDMQGRLVRFLLNNEASGAQRTVFWDGRNDEGRRCRMGIYILFFEALDETAMRIERAKKTVVLAGRL